MSRAPTTPEEWTRTIAEMQRHLQGQRYAVIWMQSGRYEVVAAHGLACGPVDNHPDAVSPELFEHVIASGEPILSEGELRHPIFASTSYLVCGIQSVLCIPVFTGAREVEGLLYVDHLVRARAFTFTDLLWLQRVAARWRVDSVSSPPLQRPPKPPPTPAPVKVEGTGPQARKLRGHEPTRFFSSLHSFLKSGIGLVPALQHLASSADEPAVRSVCADISRRVERGGSLSNALGASGAFDIESIRLVAVGERTGGLDRVFERLAQLHMRSWRLRQKLITALVYPTFLLLASLSMAVALPAVVMRGQLEALRSQGSELPALSALVLQVGRISSHPASWVLGLALLVVLSRQLRQALRRPRLQALLLRLPALGSALRRHAELRCCLSLSLSLEAGLGILEAVQLAAECTGWRLYVERTPKVLERLRNGERPAEVLGGLELFSPSSLNLVAAAEESGTLDRTFGWLADVLDREFELKLQTLSAAAEPLIMLFMGCVVGVVTVATLLPSVKLLQSFP